jgi:hypothetical protein
LRYGEENMFSNMIDFKKPDLLTYDYSPVNTQYFENAICFAEPACLPEIGVVKAVLVETAVVPTSHHLPESLNLPCLSCSIDAGSCSTETDISETNYADDLSCWAEIEFRQAQLGDRRRVKRLIQLAFQRGASPTASIPQSCGGHAAAKAAYRFYDNDAIKPEAILVSHQKATLERMYDKSLVLAIQDTTELDYTHHPATDGLGTLHDTKHHGLLVHTTLAVSPERVPLGLIQQQVILRPEAEFGKKHTRKQRPIQEKESYKWLYSLQATAQVQQLPNTHLVSVGDREADVYELFCEAKQLSQDILVRACWNRCVEHPERYLWEQLQSHPLAGTLTITVPSQPNQPGREATLSIRHALVLVCALYSSILFLIDAFMSTTHKALRPPQRPKGQKLPSVTVSAILALEEQPPQGIKPLSWLLLTTVPVYHFDDACERIQWYTCRWLIEVYHKVLKSGCRVEARQFDDVQRIRRYLAVDDVVAWRVLFLTTLGRELPDMPCDALLEAYEWQALYCFIHKTATPPQQPPTLKEATYWIAQLGGFLARKADGHPGVTVLWRGLQRLQDLASAWQLFRTNTKIDEESASRSL